MANFPADISFISKRDLRALIQALETLETHASTYIVATSSIEVLLNNKSTIISDGENVEIINRQYKGTE